MYKISKNPERTYSTMTLSGNFSLQELKNLGEELYAMAATLKPGFGLISDLTKFGSIPEGGKEIMAEIMDNLTKKGMSAVARVYHGVNQETLSNYISATVKAGYEVKYFAHMEKAIEFMNSRF